MTDGPDAPVNAPLGAEKREVTRRRIFEAMIELIATDGVDDLSVQAVADRAGVSHRTVYRHFPDKAALLEGLSDWIPAETAKRFPQFATNADIGSIDAMIPAVWDLFEDLGPHMEAYVRLIFGAGVAIQARANRTARIRKPVGTITKHLDADDAEAMVAVFRILGGAGTWFSVRRDHDLSAEKARDAFAWVANLVIRELRAGRGPNNSIKDSK